MTQSPPSTIVQLLFASTPARTFPALVRDLDDALARQGGERRLSWDNDDIVFIDFGATRVGFGYFEQPVDGLAACLVITVGPIPGIPVFGPARSYDNLCRRLVSCADDLLRADTVRWHQTTAPVTSDLIDNIADMLEARPPILRCGDIDILANRLFAGHTLPSPVAVPARPIIIDSAPVVTGQRARSKAVARAARIVSAPSLSDAEVAHLRRALRLDPDEGKPSNAQRLSAHAMNATLAILMPPVGAGLLAASYRYGVNLKHSARAMGATGALIGFAHSAAAAELVSYLPL